MTRQRRVRAQLRLATRRAGRALSRRPVLAVLGATGGDNFGDDWMAGALRTHLRSWAIADLDHPVVERRLARVGLSGGSMFDGLLVSGGTLFNSYFHRRAGDMLAAGLPAWSIGTGAGSPGFGILEDAAHPEVWADALRRFDRVTVRGPLSAASLREAGVDGVEAIGDLSLLHAPDEPLPLTRENGDRVLVNVVGLPDGAGLHDAEREQLDAIAEGIQALRRSGWTAVPFAAHPDDRSRLDALGQRLGGWEEPVLTASAATWSSAVLGGVRAIVATRVHASALGWIYGRDVVALGYRAKVRDFALQIGAGDDVTDLCTATRETISAAIAGLTDREPMRSRAIHAKVVECRDAQQKLLCEIDARARD